MGYLFALLIPLSFWICLWFGIPLWWIGALLLPAIFLKGNLYWGKLLAWPGAALGLMALTLQSSQAIFFYPVAINLSLLIAFAFSLHKGQPVVEQFARLQYPNLPESEIPYTRKCTEAWCLFFAVNGTIALITALLEDKEYWTIYNGGIAYLLMGCMFIGEWMIRQKRLKRAK